MNETILITGCAGFIGSNMCSYLLKKNYNVIGVDNFLTGKKKTCCHSQTIKNLILLNMIFVMK